MTVPISILEKFKLLNYDKVLNNIDNPKGKNKIIRALNKIIFFLQIIFKSNKINLCKLKKIEKFELRPYPMIIASKTDL